MTDKLFFHILFVHFGGIGDVILAFPAIKSLREAFPDSTITLLVEPRSRGVGAFNPAIDEILTFDAKAKPSLGELAHLVGTLRSRRFDLAIASGRSSAMAALLLLSGARHRVGYAAGQLAWTLSSAVPINTRQYAGQMYYDLVGSLVQIPAQLPQLSVAPEDQAWATEFLGDAGVGAGDRMVLLHPGASKMAKRRGIHKTWPPGNWETTALALKRGGIQVVLAGGPDDDEIVAAIKAPDLIRAHGQTRSLGQLAALVQKADLLIAVDSAPMHIGVAVGTPTIGLFGPTDPGKLLPTGTSHQAVHVKDLSCRPCLWDKRNTTCAARSCLEDLSVDLVLEAAWRAFPAIAAKKATP